MEKGRKEGMTEGQREGGGSDTEGPGDKNSRGPKRRMQV